MRATSEALALRQSESLAVLSQELFCSPDIIRQVRMRLANCYFQGPCLVPLGALRVGMLLGCSSTLGSRRRLCLCLK
jgi:hypothetical protein